ncbi:hypothetical protein OCF65_00555 [Bacillus toyonensis]|uniref:hypothetical protein n=1 Tax=Bacillus cereus group TaxID=86661 RepID=UPI000893BEF7|nr:MULTISPECIES: hypothetical protein [Bacillus cereus group]OFC97324.1 hypothetical protein BTGOE5_33640 [Bacillus thuringiensis]OTX37018.1 hypothetical protein BK717_10980 [Bacillus thuringiensis serovar malayensis]MBJ8045623.1 hypothetical protein [Bacillus cereus group sp. N18]MBJ8075902.1 hypothetical protein [Bacillus cereus group sp. N12]MBJ8099393.1 hypothetical protein [Bacillus cereus group sp. N11]
MKSNSKLNYIFLIIILILLINYLLLPIFNINTAGLLPRLLSIVTTYILPWIFLYWFIRLVKAVESK